MKYNVVLLIIICLSADIMAGEIMIAPILKMLVLPVLDQVSYNIYKATNCIHISVNQMKPTVLRVIFALSVELASMRAVLKFAMMECGELFVMISGVQMMA